MTAIPRHHAARHRARRGIVLLIVIAFTCLLLAITAGLASRASLARLRAQCDHRAVECDQVRASLEATDGPIAHWLRDESSAIVLAPDASRPAVGILRDRMIIRGRVVEVSVGAWDQCGVVPVDAREAALPLHRALPEWARAIVNRASVSEGIRPSGLDVLATGARHADAIAIFPEFNSTAAVEFRAIGGDRSALPLVDTEGTSLDRAPWALGDLVGFAGTEDSGVAININTAPIPLLEAAMRALGRGGIELIIAARAEGQQVLMGALGETAQDRTTNRSSGSRIDLVGASDRWSVRIDVTIDRVRQSWWSTYQQVSEGRSDVTWLCVQRLLITE